jgi:hypothetical protein
MITVEKYREILKDYSTPEEVIKKRIEYLTAFCRNIAKDEIENYVREKPITK